MTKKAVLLTNLGSPDKPEKKQVRNYLNQFLMDRHVIHLPWIIRRILVSLFVLPKRPKTSAEAYRSIWTAKGSPLLLLSEKLKVNLQEQVDFPVAMAMRYGEPSIENQLLELTQQFDLNEILFVPMYPHFAESTVTTSVEEARRVIKKHKLKLILTVFDPFFDNPDYISALVNSAESYLKRQYDHLLFSYHGLPELHITKLDASKKHCLKKKDCCQQPNEAHKTCYRHQVISTTECFAEQAGLSSDKYSIAFQSRLGRAKWLGPNTEDQLRELAQNGVKKVLVICPAFVTDCLETLEEIEIRGQQVFKQAGGETLTLIPCLNDDPEWVKVLAGWCQKNGIN
jgi:ferrochelatase